MAHHEDTESTKAATKAGALAVSHEVIGAAIEVHRILGPGLLETVYEKALCRELWLRGKGVERQVPLPIRYKGGVLGCEVRMDLIVERQVIVEVKCVDKLIPVHTSQLLTYLRLRKLWLGLLINFNVNRLRDGLRRVLNG